MTDTTTPQIDVAALNALLQTVQQQAQPTQPATNGWSQPQPTTTALNIQGVGVPVSVQTPAGKVRCTFWLGAEHAQTPQALMAALEQMTNAGIPIDAWQQKESSSNWGNSNNNGYKKRW
jgi:hypothetical protein